MSDQERVRENKRQTLYQQLVEQAYNRCLTDGFLLYDEVNPLAEGSAILECARRFGVRRDTIIRYLRDGIIKEKRENFDQEDPFKIMRRVLREAGFSLESSQDICPIYEEDVLDENTEERITKEELTDLYKNARHEICRLQNNLQSKDKKIENEKRKVLELKRDQKRLTKEVRKTDEIYRELAGQLLKPPQPPELPKQKRSRKKQQLRMPVITLSDLHFTEWTSPEDTMGLNAYNMDIAIKRLSQLVNGAIDVCDEISNSKTVYQGIVVNLGGDIISGDIHDELTSTNRTKTLRDPMGQILSYPASSFDASFEGAEALIAVINSFKEHFGQVYVNSVCGNHGRNGKPIKHKGHVHDSFDYLIGKLLQLHYVKDDHVCVSVAESTDMIFDIYSSRFLLTHGDRMGVKGGDGIIGSIGPIIRGSKKMRDSYANAGISYHYTIMGHWHQYMENKNVITNGSLCGPNAYSNDMRFTPEQPQQAFFVTHPRRGILFHHPIVCDAFYRQPSLDPLVQPPPQKPNMQQPFKIIIGHKKAKPKNDGPDRPNGTDGSGLPFSGYDIA